MMTEPEKDLFLCHVGQDKPWVEKLGGDVEAEEWDGRPLAVFLDKWDIDVGENIVVKLNQALARARFVALIMSPEMIRSDWCNAEMSAVLMGDPTNRKKRIIPIRRRDYSLDGRQRLEIPPLLAAMNYLDFTKDAQYRKELARLLARLRGEAPPRGGRSRRSRGSVDSALARAIPPARADADDVPEVLLGNLLPVREIPGIVWSAPTTLRKKSELPNGFTFPPCLLREERLYAFTDLGKPAGPFANIVGRHGVRRDAVADWKGDDDRWRWVVNLLNQALRQHVTARGLAFDGDHDRFFFLPVDGGRVRVTWGTGTTTTVARPPNPGSGGSWVHQGASLRFETVGTRMYLSIDPTWVFTKDGLHPVDRDKVGPLAMQWSGKERNGAILRHVLMWSDFLTSGKKEGAIPAGDQRMVVGRLPLTVRTPVGLPNDQVTMKSLLRFTQAELDLDVPELARHFAVSASHEDEPAPSTLDEDATEGGDGDDIPY
jgi:hypothetical protein